MHSCAACGYKTSEPFRFCPQCAAPAGSEHHRRKPATLLFCDASGSTALGERLDAEAVRELMFSYFHEMRSAIERHGGTVEKFIGDAVMAVFGIPDAHEDDPVRACRAAFEMQQRLPSLNEELQRRYGSRLALRIGINTGEVIAGDPSTRETFVSGDPVNVAARLEQAARPGDILLGEQTFRLARHTVEAEPVQPIAAKGKAEPVPAYRLISVPATTAQRSFERPFVGRSEEYRTLEDIFDRAVSERRLRLATIVGEPGVGKSRLAAELILRIAGRARLLMGRCLAYGEGITWWPFAEIVRSAAGIHDEHDTAQALSRLESLALEPAVIAALAATLGLDERPVPAEQVPWAVRKLIEALAVDRPIIVLVEDVHWAEPALLDLLLDLADHAQAPGLLLSTARPELLAKRPAWPGIVPLDVFGATETRALLASTSLPATEYETAVRASGGNPLFVEELAAFLTDQPRARVVPPTLDALLAARLDLLPEPERSAAERGAIEGELFHRGAVGALSSETAGIRQALDALVARDLVHPAQAQFVDEAAFRFKHALVRDAAYAGISKRLRAELHERFAAWLEVKVGTRLAEVEEIVGYHLEQAHRYQAELGMPRDDELADEALRHLTAGGRRAYLRGDYPASVTLLERAAALMRPGVVDLLLETTLADALFESGRGTDAVLRADAIAERAALNGDRVGELCGKILAGRLRTNLEPESATEELAALLEDALPVLEMVGDDIALYVAYYARANVELVLGRMDGMVEALERAVAHVREVGSPPVFRGWIADGRLHGTTPVRDLLAWLDRQNEADSRNPLLRKARAHALAKLGRFDEARELLAGVLTEMADRGGGIQLGGIKGVHCVDVELLAGDPAAAVEFGEEGCKLLDELGEHGYLSTAAGMLAQALYAMDRLDDADTWASRARSLGARDDLATQMLWRQVRAKVLARRGKHDEAERLAREAVAIGEGSDMLDAKGDAYVDLAEALSLAGRIKEATDALAQALTLYELKGSVVKADRTRDLLAMLHKKVDDRPADSEVNDSNKIVRPEGLEPPTF